MRITVFTATYNRAYTIEKLYRSLQAQTFHDFEWLVIDDGSTDDTREIFKKWSREENTFLIRYITASNKGKMKEINYGLDLAQGELFFTVDSDDILTIDALEKIDAWEKMLPQDGRYCGFAGNVSYNGKTIAGDIFKEDYYDATLFMRYKNFGDRYIGADRAWVFYTDIYKKYKFPEYPNEKFIAEAVSWNRMAHDGLLIRCFNDVIYLMEHQDDGYTNKMSATLISSPRGYGLWQAEMIRFLNYSATRRIKQYYIFYCDLRDKHTIKEISSFIDCPILLMAVLALVNKHKLRRKK